MIEIAHEAPIGYMKSMKQLTDYDYALACLFGKIPGYFEYFQESLKEGRKVLLDNGVFEDGVSMEAGQYANWIEKLQPTEYIVPDVFDEVGSTLSNFIKWQLRYDSLPGKKIGVCQGKNFNELNACYHYMSTHADKIAINFASVAYQDCPYLNNIPADTWDYKAVYGRFMYLNLLIESGLFNFDKPHHLLGCSLPLEFTLLKSAVNDLRIIDHFESMDTSAPVVWGILNGTYPEDLDKISKKNKTKLKDLIETTLTPQQSSDILFNVAKFKNHLR